MSHRNAKILAVAVVVYATALVLMHYAVPRGVRPAPINLAVSGGVPAHGTVWLPPGAPKAVLLIGHGVSENQGTMATIAKAFAAQGYAALAFDFHGHGRSRAGFDWRANPEQVRDWCAWAQAEFPGLPLAYLGHSMGGFAGTVAFQQAPPVQAFVSLGAMPGAFPPVKTLVAAGQFEELFTPDEARTKTAGKADLIISPWSNHALEPWDPVLIGDMVRWVDTALDLPSQGGFPWAAWGMAMLATVMGTLGAIVAAAQATLPLRGVSAGERSMAPNAARRWSVNPYRLTARLLGPLPRSAPPRAAQPLRAAVIAVVFAMLTVGALSLLLSRDIFTAYPDHPRRWLGWLVAVPLLLLPCWLGAVSLERAGAGSTRRRFLLGVLTRGVPLLILSLILRVLIPKAAFGAMMLGIFGLIAMVLAAIYALAVRGTRDHRAGALATAMVFAWVLSFWFPLTW